MSADSHTITKRPDSKVHWENMERRENAIWRQSLGILFLLAVGLAVTSWQSFRSLPQRLEALPIGLVILVVLFGIYVWHQRRQVGELRGLLRGMQETAAAPPSDQQIEKLLDVVARSQHGYRELIDSLDHIVFNLSTTGEIKVVNRRFSDVLGVSFNDLIRQPLTEFFSEPEPEAAVHVVEQLRDKRPWNGIIRAKIRRTGEIRYFDTVLQPIMQGTHVTAISGIARDVTSQRESEQRFTELFESLQEGVYCCNSQGVMLEVNPAMVRMLGFQSREELMACNANDLYEDLAQRHWVLNELSRNKVVRNHEITLRRKDGKLLRCLDSCSIIRDITGNTERIQGALVDITERVEIEQRLHREQELNRRVVECFPDLLVTLDSSGSFTFVSVRSEEMLGIPPAALIGTKISERAHPEDLARLQEHLHNLTSELTRSEQLEFRMRHSNGTWRVVRISASALLDSAGHAIGIVASARDITEEKQFEQQLIQSERLAAMGQMLAGVAHELNNPLTAILGVSDLLRERAVDDSMRRQADLVRQQARRAADIVQSLLAFSRRSTPGRSPVKIADLVERALHLHGSALTKNRITIEFHPAKDLPAVEGDASLLLQVLLNLMINSQQAITAVRDHGSIQVNALRLDDNLVLTVSDDGPGIPPEIIGRIFDPFFTTKRPGGGAGLGLTIAMAIVREHGGTIEAESIPGRGASIKVTLPVVRFGVAPVATANPAAQSKQVVSELQGHSVLVVDDEDGIRELVSDGLAARGMAVETVTTCEEALSLLAIRHFDIILCDFNLPGLSGEAFFDQLAQRSDSLASRFVFMTGALLDASAMKSFRQRGARIIEKPFQFATLVTLFSEILASQSAHQPVKVS